MKPSTGQTSWLLLDPLLSSLLDLIFALEEKLPPLTVGGGFGLYLKREHLKRTGERTVMPPEKWPGIRSTRDIDIFLRVDVLANLAQVRVLAASLKRLGYQAVERAKYMQFVKAIEREGQSQEVKIDLLVGPLGSLRPKVKIKEPRIQPKRKGKEPSGSPGLHAFHTPEAIGVDESPLVIALEGQRSTGEACQTQVCLPQAFPYMLMKLFAFHDQKNDSDPKKDQGRHHALDLYGIIAMMTEPEYDFAKHLMTKYGKDAKVRQARQIVREDFLTLESSGVLGLRGHALFTPSMDVDSFLKVLHELVPPVD